MRFRRRAVLQLCSVIAAPAIALGAAGHARASVGPGCDGGVACADQDGDGFIACTCAPAGTRCDCDDADPRTYPGAPETCDAPKDRSCDGTAGGGCGPKKGCLQSACVPECVPLDDFGCAPSTHCETQPNGQRLCVAPDCTTYGCPAGSTCDDSKRCVDACNPSVRCPVGQQCRGFGCVDPCDGVVCIAGSACENGVCVASCDCLPGSTGCAAGQTCDRSLPDARCVEQSCAGVVCPSGSHCTAGACAGDCEGVACPPKRLCRAVAKAGGRTRAECIDLCEPNPCVLPFTCDWRTGGCVAPTFPEAGLQPVPGADADDLLVVGGAGLTCSTRGLARVSVFGLVATVAAAAALLARRRQRRGNRR